jgi:hypothetical protein
MTDKRRAKIFRLITVAAATLATLVLAEIALIIMDLPHSHQLPIKSPQFRKLSPEHPWYEIGHINLINQAATIQYDSNERGYFRFDNVVTHRFNNLGFRGPDFSEKKPPDTIRISFFGDSFTMGEGVFFQDTYPQQARHYLMRNHKQQIESLNFGVSAYNSEQEEKLIGLILPKFHPDILVLGYTMNDPNTRLPETQEEAEFWDPVGALRARYPPPKLRVLRLGYIAWMNWLSNTKQADFPKDLHDPNGVFWPNAEAALHKIGKRCREFDIPCIAVLFPELVDLQEYPLMDEHQQVKETLNAAGFVVLDILEDIKHLEAADLIVHPTDSHPNELVHRLIGEKLATLITAML